MTTETAIKVTINGKTYLVEIADLETQNIGTWNSAINICHALRQGGHSDWTLPTIDELLEIAEHSYLRDARYWTANTYGTALAAYVLIENGKPAGEWFDSNREVYSVRAIRRIAGE